VLLAAITGCGGDSPAKAVYAFAHDVEHGLVVRACSRVYEPERVPPQLARALDLEKVRDGASSDGALAGSECVQRLASADVDFHEPRVHDVRVLDVDPQGGIDRVAIASVAFDGESRVAVPLIEQGGRWYVVLEL
jgi:hypothetical protein